MKTFALTLLIDLFLTAFISNTRTKQDMRKDSQVKKFNLHYVNSFHGKLYNLVYM